MKTKVLSIKFILVILVFVLSIPLVFGQSICGDCTENGVVDILDALIAARCYVQLITCPPEEIADVDCDGDIDILDALQIARFYVLLLPSLNCCTPTPEPTETPTPTPEPTPTPTPTPEPETPTPTPTPEPTMAEDIYLEAEDYTTANDNTPSDNIGLRYRFGDGVDIEDCADGGFNTGWVAGGEWLKWNIDLVEGETYNVWIRASNDQPDPPQGLPGVLFVNKTLNPVPVGGGVFYVPNTDPYGIPEPPGHWQTFQNYFLGAATLESGLNEIWLQHAGYAGSFDVDYVYLTGGEDPPPARTPVPEPIEYQRPVDNYGQLQVIGTDLCDSTGIPIQLKGLSSHHIRWHWLVKGHTVQNAAYSLGIDIIRIAVYTDLTNGGYASAENDELLLHDRMIDYVEDAIATGIYVIVDWHLRVEGDPNDLIDLAKDFFDEVSLAYGHYPNVIWEICNKPNNVSWSLVKQYAEEVIPVIRANDPDNIIIVGTPSFSIDVDLASQDPVTGYTNIMYALHFSAASHGQVYRDKANTALTNGLPIIVSEFGTSDSSGTGGYDFVEAQAWLDWMNVNNISWINWALCNKLESTSIFQEPVGLTGPWTDSDPPSQTWPASDFTESGSWIVEKLNE